VVMIYTLHRVPPNENPPEHLYFHHSVAINAFEGTFEGAEALMFNVDISVARKALYFHRALLPIPLPSFHVLLLRAPALLGLCFENH
jgi:hypothetical protein